MDRRDAATSPSKAAVAAPDIGSVLNPQRAQQHKQTKLPTGTTPSEAATASTRKDGGKWWTGSSSGDGNGSNFPQLPRPPGIPSSNVGGQHANGAAEAAGATQAQSPGDGGGGGGRVAEASSETPRFWRASDYNANEFAAARRASERVILNLSGTTFMTTRDTLARNPHTYFAAMLRMQPAPTPTGSQVGGHGERGGSSSGSVQGNGSSVSGGSGGRGGEGGGGEEASGVPPCAGSNAVEFFIDRDPTHFRFILNYLRDSYIGLDAFGEEDLHFLEELSHEAQFFNIAGLCADISRRMSEIARKHREGPSGDKDFRLVQCTTAQIQDVFHEWVIEKNYEFECMQIVQDTAYIVLGRRVSRGELALVERLMKT